MSDSDQEERKQVEINPYKREIAIELRPGARSKKQVELEKYGLIMDLAEERFQDAHHHIKADKIKNLTRKILLNPDQPNLNNSPVKSPNTPIRLHKVASEYVLTPNKSVPFSQLPNILGRKMNLFDSASVLNKTSQSKKGSKTERIKISSKYKPEKSRSNIKQDIISKEEQRLSKAKEELDNYNMQN